MATRRFEIEIRDYEPGENPDPLTNARIERHMVTLLAGTGSDGVVIVTEVQE